MLVDREGALFGQPPRDVIFTMGLVALAAKMAKADGVVVDGRSRPSSRSSRCRTASTSACERLFDLAMQTTDGFEAYARQIGDAFKDEPALLEDVLDGLFHIAKADDAVHEAEYRLSARRGDDLRLLGRRISSASRPATCGSADDPYLILKADRSMSDEELKRHYRKLVADNHPDREIARGLPPEAVKIATERLAAINAAWDRIAAERNLR